MSDFLDGCIAAKDARIAMLTEQRDAEIAEVVRSRQQIAALEAEVAALHRERKGEVWYWQGDGHDFPESLTCPVLMEPEKLRALLAEVERLQGVELSMGIQLGDLRSEVDIAEAALAPFVALARDGEALSKELQRFFHTAPPHRATGLLVILEARLATSLAHPDVQRVVTDA